jgi:hypothetical protein
MAEFEQRRHYYNLKHKFDKIDFRLKSVAVGDLAKSSGTWRMPPPGSVAAYPSGLRAVMKPVRRHSCR